MEEMPAAGASEAEAGARASSCWRVAASLRLCVWGERRGARVGVGAKERMGRARWARLVRAPLGVPHKRRKGVRSSRQKQPSPPTPPSHLCSGTTRSS